MDLARMDDVERIDGAAPTLLFLHEGLGSRSAWRGFPAELARATFDGWSGVWLDPAFRAWNIEACLPRVRAPTLVIQGEDDEYGTSAQVEAIRRQLGAPCETLLLPECGHAPHRDQPARTLAAMHDFIARVVNR